MKWCNTQRSLPRCWWPASSISRVKLRDGAKFPEPPRPAQISATKRRAGVRGVFHGFPCWLGITNKRTANEQGGDRNRLPFLSLILRDSQLRHRLLCDLAVNFGFGILLAANSNLDLFRLGLSLLGEVDLQHALIVVGAHLPGVHGVGQCERAGEASVLPLDATVVLFFFFLLKLALAVDNQCIVLYADINVFFLNARDFNFQSEIVLVFVDVHRRCEAGGRQRLLWAFGVERFTQKTVHAVLQGGGGTERIPTG